MAYSKSSVVSLILAVAVIAGFFMLAQFGPSPTAPKPDTVVVTRVLESKAVIETTRVTLTKWKNHIDTLPGDTIWMTRTQFDTIYRECMNCAEEYEEFVRFADSVIKAQNDSIFKLNRALDRCKDQRPWWAIGGLALCAGAGALGR